MCSPCRTVSSPVLTMAVISDGGTTSTIPRRSRAAPTPPASATIVVAGVAIGGRLAAPPVGTGVRRRCARLPACRRSDLHPPTRAGCPSASMPPRCWGSPPASGCSAPARSAGLSAHPRVEVSAFAVSWRRRHRIAALVPAGVPDRAAGHAGPTAARRLGSVPGATRRVVHRRPRRGARDQLRRTPDPPRRPGGDRPRPDRRAVPGAVRPARRWPTRRSSAGPRPRGPGCTPRRSSWPTRWWPSWPSILSGSVPSITAYRCPRPTPTPQAPAALPAP